MFDEHYHDRYIREEDPPPFDVGDTVRTILYFRGNNFMLATPTGVVTRCYYYPGAGWACRVRDELGEEGRDLMARVFEPVGPGARGTSGHAAEIAALFGVT